MSDGMVLDTENTETTETTDTVEPEENTDSKETVAQLADKAKELEVRKLTLPSQGAVADLEAEYSPPVAYQPREKTADDFRTSDDAQQAYLREEIDEDVFSQVVSKLGKPSNRTEDSRDRADLGFERELPKWVFQTPRDSGPKVSEMLEVMAIEEEEKEVNRELELKGPESPYRENETVPNPM